MRQDGFGRSKSRENMEEMECFRYLEVNTVVVHGVLGAEVNHRVGKESMV